MMILTAIKLLLNIQDVTKPMNTVKNMKPTGKSNLLKIPYLKISSYVNNNVISKKDKKLDLMNLNILAKLLVLNKNE